MGDSNEICCLSLPASGMAADDDWLSLAERAVQSELKVSRRRADWRLGRWTAKQTVQRYYRQFNTPLQLNQIEVIAASDGAPELFVNGRESDLAVSISHSHGLGFAAIGPRNRSVGCDIEKIEARSPALMADYFTEAELALFHAAPPLRQAFHANLIWSAKESVMKALRKGTRLDPSLIQIAVFKHERADAGALHASLITDDHSFRGRWWGRQGFVKTIAADCPALSIRHF